MASDRRAGFAAAWAVGEFRALWVAEAQSIVGDQLAKVALSVVVYSRTGSAGLAALSYAALLLPALVSGPLLSWIADAYPRRTVMTWCAVVQAGLVALMAIPQMPTAALFALIVLVQLVQAPFAAAQASVLPVVLSGEPYQAAQALRQITRQTAMLLGLGGGGLAVAWMGVSWALALDAATFVVAAIVIVLGVRHRSPASSVADGDNRGGFWSAAVLIWRDQRLRSLVALAWLAGFAVVPEGLAAPFATALGAGPQAVGWLLAADPAAMAVGAFLLVRFVRVEARLRWMGPLAIMTVVPLLGYAARPGLAAALVLLAISGACAAYQVTAVATFMDWVPDAQRARAFGAARGGLVAAQGLGVLGGGLVAELTGSVTTTVALAGAAGLLVAVPAAVAWHRAYTRHSLLVGTGVR